MLELNGKNLGERHKELNVKVNETALKNVNFEEIKKHPEQYDVDKLFKIDLACKYKNIEYILEVLKSGDALYITRALNCDWIFDGEYSNFINVDYLQHNIFPFMSLKMKKKLLSTISIYVKDEDRAKAFCDYCMNSKLTNIARKFVVSTNDDYKLQTLRTTRVMDKFNYEKNFKYLIGNSFSLADAYLTPLNRNKLKILNKICYLYSLSNEKYLDLLENQIDIYDCQNSKRLGLRMSKKILTKNKARVIAKPLIYINCLNKMSIVKYSSTEDAKLYIAGLLPHDVKLFWEKNFCALYEYILNMIPAEERFQFIKQVFCNKYPKQPFEMILKFHSLKYFRFMTPEQKNKWGLDQIASNNEILGVGNDYKWYKFVNFEIAFDEIKKLVMITPDNDKRRQIVDILVESAKTQRDLEKLFKYYHDRHNNEKRSVKENFIGWVSCNHNIYEFDGNCWDAFNKLYQNLDVYNMLDTDRSKHSFKLTAFIYHVIHGMEVPDALKLFIDNNMYFYGFQKYLVNISKEKQELLYQYLYKFYMDIINELDSVPYNEEVKHKLRKYISYILDLMREFGKPKNDTPEVVKKHIKLDEEKFWRHEMVYTRVKPTTQNDLLRLLKKDAELVAENLPLVKEEIDSTYRYRLHKLLKKIKVYFPNDISQAYLNFFNEILATNALTMRFASAVSHGIFHLAEDNFKVDFMTKYAPTKGKINRSEIDESLLNIQNAICSSAFYSRPPVPLKNMLMYVKGDYVHNCLPMFNYYSANLPLPLCMEFIEAILNNPVSIQKHGLRLAFVYFNPENLRKLVLRVWKRTANVSLRFIIYKALYDKILQNENLQDDLFETLIMLTLELNQNDNSEIFTLWRSRALPHRLKSDYIDALWKAVSGFPSNKTNLERMADVINYMCSDHRLIRHDTIRAIVEKLVEDIFSTEDSMKSSIKKSTPLDEKKWKLIACHITHVPNKDELEGKLKLINLVLTECAKRLNLLDDNKYIVRKFCAEFVSQLLEPDLLANSENCEYDNQILILESLKNMLQNLFTLEEVYLSVWEIRTNIAMRKVLIEILAQISNAYDETKKQAILRDIVLDFGRSIGNLIMEYIGMDMYFKTYESRIQSNLLWLTRLIGYLNKRIPTLPEDVLSIICAALMEFKCHEIYMFALSILPENGCLYYKEDYMHVLNTLKCLDNLEIKCKIYDKFIYTDFEHRPFLKELV